MKYKLLTLIIMVLSALAASASDFGYITACDVCLRQSPSANAGQVARLDKYTLVKCMRYSGAQGWTHVSYMAYNPERGRYGEQEGYVSTKYVRQLEAQPLPNYVYGADITLLTTAPGIEGYLLLTREDDRLDYELRLIDSEMRAAGGTGTIDVQSGTTTLTDGHPGLAADFPTFYEPATGILFFAGYAWQVHK